MLTREVKYTPIGPALPMMGFMLSPDHKLGYSVMYTVRVKQGDRMVGVGY